MTRKLAFKEHITKGYYDNNCSDCDCSFFQQLAVLKNSPRQ